MGMDCLVLEGDSQPSVHSVHQLLGVCGHFMEIFGGLGLKSSEHGQFCAFAQSIGLSFLLERRQVIWAFRCQQQMLPLNPSAL